MADIFYAYEKFTVAVHQLAESDGPLPERLRHAFVSKSWTAVSEDDLPKDAHEAYSELRKRAQGDLDDVENARQIARLICEIHTAISSRVTKPRIPNTAP